MVQTDLLLKASKSLYPVACMCFGRILVIREFALVSVAKLGRKQIFAFNGKGLIPSSDQACRVGVRTFA